MVLAPRVAVSRFDVPIEGLPPAFEGFRIAHITDLHVGHGMWGPAHVTEALAAIRDFSPEVIVNTGDFLQGKPSVERVEAVAGMFLVRGARSIAILGNHDYYAGTDVVSSLTERLQSIGVEVLVNQGVCLERNGSGLTVFGLVNDKPDFDLNRAVQRLEVTARPRLLLVHEPDIVERLPDGVADLALAGHTHGGQVTAPGLERWIVRRFCGSSYVEGMYRINGTPVYVNRGLGCTGFPVRFRANPEVALIRLTR